MSEKDPWDFSEYGAEQNRGATPRSDALSSRPDAADGFGTASDHGFDAAFGSDATAEPTFAPAGSTGGSAGLAVAGPPLSWLAISAAAALVGLVLAATLGAVPPLAVLSWLLAGPVAIGALAVYIGADTRRRAGPIYVAPNWLTAGYYACLAVCLIGVVVSAIRIALWVGRW